MRIPNDAGGAAIARGRALPEVGQRGQRTAAALNSAAQTMGAIGQDMIQEDAKRKDAADRLEAGRVLLEHRSAVTDLLNGAREGLRAGQLKDEDEARAFFEDGLAEMDGVELPAVGEFVKQDLQMSMAEAKQRAGLGLDDVLRGHRTDRIKATTVASLGALNKEAILPTANLTALEAQIDATITTAGKADTDLDPAWLEGQRQSAKASAWGSHVARRIELGENSMDELKAVERDLTAGDGKYAGKLQAEDNNTLLARVHSAKDRLTAKWEQASAKRDAGAERMLNMYRTRVAETDALDPGVDEQVWRAVKGTPFEADFKAIQAENKEIQKVLLLPVWDQRALLARTKAEYRQAGNDLQGKRGQFVARLEKALETNVTNLRERPLEVVEARTGNSMPRISAPMLLDTNGIDVAVKVLRDRVVTLDATSKQFGVNVKAPLFKEEADQLGAILKQQSPTVRAQTLGVLAKAIDDPEVFKGAVTQLLGDDPRAFAAGLAHGLGFTTTEGRKVGELIEQGSVILKDKSVIVPKSGQSDDGSRAAFNTYITTDMVPAGSSQREVYYQSALAVYASLAAQEGTLGREINSKLFQRATRIAVGGVLDYRGQSVVAPRYGMTDDDLTSALDAQLMAAAKANNIDFDLREMRLIPDDKVPGRYYVKQDAFNFQPDKSGNPLFVEVR